MDYSKHYTLLIERAKTRRLDGYSERHHILPKCLKGTDDEENIVKLTPEEHYLAHQLLTRIYPNVHSLKKAARMMCVSSDNQKRNNKLYGWIRRMSRPIGAANGMFGKTHTDEVCNKLGKLASERFSGKSYDELYGKEKANSLRKIRSEKQKEYRKSCPIVGASNPNAKSYKLIDPTGTEYFVTGAMKQFCKEHKLYRVKLLEVANGTLEEYKGWKVFYV
jgi:hypothetical protein